MTEARKIAEPPLRLIEGTGSPRPLTEDLDWEALPARLTDAMLARVEAIANSPLPVLPVCDDAHFAQCLRVMVAVLPKRHSDDLSGDLFVAAYQRMLGHHPRAAISFMSERALETCQWFPTIAECQRIIEGWRRDDADIRLRQKAELRARNERETRFQEAMESLSRREMSQAEIDALPERWKRIAETRSYLWLNQDGTYRVRPLAPIAPEVPAVTTDDRKPVTPEEAAAAAEQAHATFCGGIWEELQGGHRRCDGCGAFQRWEASGWVTLPESAYEAPVGRELDDAPESCRSVSATHPGARRG